MLSTSQQAIIDNLISEFEKSNTSKKSNLTTLIDIEGIKERHEADRKLRLETELNNLNFKLELEKHILDWSENLSETLLSLGLKAKVWGHSEISIKITAIDKHICHTKEIVINGDVTTDPKSKQFGNGGMANGFEFSFYYTPNSSAKFRKIENLIADDRFKAKLERLYGMA
jgi:hypothetical protein